MTQLETKIDVREYWRILLRRRWWFLIPVVSAVLTGAIFAFTARPVYQSTVSFSFRRPPPMTRGLGELVQSTSASDDGQELRGLLTSEDVLKQVIATTGLMPSQASPAAKVTACCSAMATSK